MSYLALLDANLSATVLSHWTFDDASASAVLADRQASHPGTYTGSPTKELAGLQPNAAVAETSARFVATSSQWAGVTHHADFQLSAGAISGWVRPRTVGSTQPVISKSGGAPLAAGDFDLIVRFDQSIDFAIYNGTTSLNIRSPTGYVATNQIVHFAVLFSGSGFELWLDGNRVGTPITAYTAGLTANTRNWRFARAGWSETVFGDVDLDDILVLSTVPTVGERMTLAAIIPETTEMEDLPPGAPLPQFLLHIALLSRGRIG